MVAQKLFDNAKKNKADEFYTLLKDIELELKHYKNQFRGKVVFCNCDDPYESNFFKYFALNFNYLGLKKLIATCYSTSPIKGKQISLFDILEYGSIATEDSKRPYKIIINEVNDYNKDGAIDLVDVEYLLKNKKNVLTLLKGDGDFRSTECIDLLKQSDIVVTNPPFSLFREYLAQLTDLNKQFIIIGNTNALTYKEVFRLFKEDKMRTGYTNFNVGMHFVVPDSYENFTKVEEGKKIARVSTSCWFTNMEVARHKETLTLYKNYTPEKYPKYENYDAINCDTYIDIPCDYYGHIGVPITFLDKYNPEQFEILGFTHRNDPYKLKTKIFTKDDADNFNDLNGSPIIKNGDEFRFIYMRIIIKRKEVKNEN